MDLQQTVELIKRTREGDHTIHDQDEIVKHWEQETKNMLELIDKLKAQYLEKNEFDDNFETIFIKNNFNKDKDVLIEFMKISKGNAIYLASNTFSKNDCMTLIYTALKYGGYNLLLNIWNDSNWNLCFIKKDIAINIYKNFDFKFNDKNFSNDEKKVKLVVGWNGNMLKKASSKFEDDIHFRILASETSLHYTNILLNVFLFALGESKYNINGYYYNQILNDLIEYEMKYSYHKDESFLSKLFKFAFPPEAEEPDLSFMPKFEDTKRMIKKMVNRIRLIWKKRHDIFTYNSDFFKEYDDYNQTEFEIIFDKIKTINKKLFALFFEDLNSFFQKYVCENNENRSSQGIAHDNINLFKILYNWSTLKSSSVPQGKNSKDRKKSGNGGGWNHVLDINDLPTKINDLGKNRLCALVSETKDDNTYIYILYRDRENEELYLYTGRVNDKINLPSFVTKSPINLILLENDSTMCFPAMCFLAMIHKYIFSMQMREIVESLYVKPSLNVIFTNITCFLQQNNEFNYEFFQIFKNKKIR